MQLPAEAVAHGDAVHVVLDAGFALFGKVIEADARDAEAAVPLVIDDVGELVADDADLRVEGDVPKVHAVEGRVVVDQDLIDAGLLAQQGTGAGLALHRGVDLAEGDRQLNVPQLRVERQGDQGRQFKIRMQAAARVLLPQAVDQRWFECLWLEFTGAPQPCERPPAAWPGGTAEQDQEQAYRKEPFRPGDHTAR